MAPNNQKKWLNKNSGSMPRNFDATTPPAPVISNVELDEGAIIGAAVQYEVQRTNTNHPTLLV